GEHDGTYVRTIVIDARHRRDANVDPLLGETRAILPADDAGAVGAQQDTRRPGFQRQRKAGAGRAAADHGDDLIAMLPLVAVWAVTPADAVACANARDVANLVP